MKYLIIGGVAGGATVAARLRRMDEKAEIILMLLFGCVGYKFGESLSKALLLAKRFAFLKECLFKGRNLLRCV